MAWMDGYSSATELGDRAQSAWRWPLGAASPLWAVFGAAATSGVAYWWMTQWTRAVNVEAFLGALRPVGASEIATRIEILAEPAPTEVVEASEPEPIEFAEIEPQSEPTVFAELETETAPIEPRAAGEAETEAAGDDLTRMNGIGPKLALALAERGVTRFAEIAAWTEADLAEVDLALSLKGRAVREAWVAQARRLAEGG